MSVEKRYAEFLKQTELLAKRLKLNVEFTTRPIGFGYMSYEAPVAVVVTTDTHAYMEADGRTEFGA